MVGEAISFFLRNLPAFLFVAALVFAASFRGNGGVAERLLAWILLLPIGVTGLWAGISHIFFPAMAVAHIRWQVSPFQFEVGMADLAIGVTACIAILARLVVQGRSSLRSLHIPARRCNRTRPGNDAGHHKACWRRWRTSSGNLSVSRTALRACPSGSNRFAPRAACRVSALRVRWPR